MRHEQHTRISKRIKIEKSQKKYSVNKEQWFWNIIEESNTNIERY